MRRWHCLISNKCTYIISERKKRLVKKIIWKSTPRKRLGYCLFSNAGNVGKLQNLPQIRFNSTLVRISFHWKLFLHLGRNVVGLDGSQTVHFPVGCIRSAHKSPLQLVLLTFSEVVHNSKTQLIDSLHCLLISIREWKRVKSFHIQGMVFLSWSQLTCGYCTPMNSMLPNVWASPTWVMQSFPKEEEKSKYFPRHLQEICPCGGPWTSSSVPNGGCGVHKYQCQC